MGVGWGGVRIGEERWKDGGGEGWGRRCSFE